MTIDSVSGAAAVAAQSGAGTAKEVDRTVAVLRKVKEQAVQQGDALVALIEQSGVPATKGQNLNVYA